MAKYDKIGIGYNTTRKADKYLTERFLALLNPKRDALYLDIGCGTGNYTNEFQKQGFSFIGIDPSKEMLDKAKAKNKNIDWRIGQVENLELENNSVDGIVAGLTIHHWQNLEKGFEEMARVLKPNGKIVIFTSLPKQMKNYWLNHYFPKMMEISTNLMPSQEHIEKAAKQTNLKIEKTEKYFVQADLEDLFLQSGKQNPELYFKPEIRKGISSFAALSNKEEVDSGLEKLRKDIQNQKIKEIIKSYESDSGDYIFFILGLRF